MKHIHYHCDEHKHAWIEFAAEDAKVNVLGSVVMQELQNVLEKVIQDNAVVAIFCSAKDGQFIAGADIHELAAIDSVEEAHAKSTLGQNIFQGLADLPCPSIALINGPCMGGGTELALACTWRIITDHQKVSIALPEVRLGIIPGWGGTVRLSRIIGFAEAVSLICSGRTVRGRKCLRNGLAHHQVNDAFAREQCREFIATKKFKKKPKKHRLGMFGFILSRTVFGRKLVINKARRAVIAQGGTHYPAPLRVLDLLSDTYNESTESALSKEAQLFSELSQTQISSYMRQLFLANEAAKKRYSDVECDVSCAEVQHAGIIGAGVMGGGIAWLFTQHGITVRVKDLQWKALTQAFRTAARMYKELIKKRQMSQQEARVAMNRLSGGLDDIALRHADIIIEAVVENVEVKRTVLAECEKHIDQETTLCTNTSSLCLSQMSDALAHPQRFVGMHFFNPVNRMPLVEVIASAQSAEQHLARVVRTAVRMGKTPIVVKDCAGFLVNRLLTPYMNEALHLMQDGVDIERIDRLLQTFGMPMGPCALADEVGIDVAYKVAHNIQQAYGERMAIAPLLETIAQDMKLLGKKSGKGLYIHGKKRKTVNKKVVRAQQKFKVQQKVVVIKTITDADVLDRCLLIMVNEAARCLEEGIVASATDLDLAMIMGTGFPPFRGGLLHYADAYGLSALQQRLTDLASDHGSRFDPAPALLQRTSFYDAADVVDNSDDSAL